MVTSDFRPEVEMWPFRARTVKIFNKPERFSVVRVVWGCVRLE